MVEKTGTDDVEEKAEEEVGRLSILKVEIGVVYMSRSGTTTGGWKSPVSGKTSAILKSWSLLAHQFMLFTST